MARGVLLIAHGSVDELDELPELLTNIRRGRPPPPELLAEVRRRYEAIGGKSPLNDINAKLGKALEKKLRVPVAVANRMLRPSAKESLESLAARGVTTVDVVPLAQHSAPVYAAAVAAAAKEVPAIETVHYAPNWGRRDDLTKAFADAVEKALGKVRDGEQPYAEIVFSAHSLPMAVIDGGDPYRDEFEGSVEAVVAELRRRKVPFQAHHVAYQSQGMSAGPDGKPMKWLGPDVKDVIGTLGARDVRDIVLAPIGFLADHVEILYDLDIEAKAWAKALALRVYRSPSLNASPALVDVLAAVADECSEGISGVFPRRGLDGTR